MPSCAAQTAHKKIGIVAIQRRNNLKPLQKRTHSLYSTGPDCLSSGEDLRKCPITSMITSAATRTQTTKKPRMRRKHQRVNGRKGVNKILPATSTVPRSACTIRYAHCKQSGVRQQWSSRNDAHKKTPAVTSAETSQSASPLRDSNGR